MVIEVTDELVPQNQGLRLTAAATSVPSGFSGDLRAGPPPRPTWRCRCGRWAPPTWAAPGSANWAAAGLVTEVHAGLCGGAVGGHVLGPGPVVPDDLLGHPAARGLAD